MAGKGLIVVFVLLTVVTWAQPPDNFKGQVDFGELSHHLGSVAADTILINYWATWCKPCVEELPVISRYAEVHPQVKVILVSLDFENQKESKLYPFISENGIVHDVYLLVDPKTNDWIPRVAEEWTGAIPATEVRTKGERFFHEGVFTSKEELFDFTKKGKL